MFASWLQLGKIIKQLDPIEVLNDKEIIYNSAGLVLQEPGHKNKA